MKNQTFQFRKNFIKAALVTSICFSGVQGNAQINTIGSTGNVGINLPTGSPANDLEVMHNTTYDNSGFSGTDFPAVRIHDNFYNSSSPSVSPSPYNVFEIWNHSYLTIPSTTHLFDNPLFIVNTSDCAGCAGVGIGKQPFGTPGTNSYLDIAGSLYTDGSVFCSGAGSFGSNVVTSGNAIVYGVLRVGPMASNGVYAGYTLSVDGDMIAKKCIIQTSDWADDVFADNYKLRPLNELQAYIQANNHLPDVPSEAEVVTNGINIAEMNATLLRKVEELTLYMFEIKKENEILAKKIQELSKK